MLFFANITRYLLCDIAEAPRRGAGIEIVSHADRKARGHGSVTSSPRPKPLVEGD